jgi:hypothetical protein
MSWNQNPGLPGFYGSRLYSAPWAMHATTVNPVAEHLRRIAPPATASRPEIMEMAGQRGIDPIMMRALQRTGAVPSHSQAGMLGTFPQAITAQELAGTHSLGTPGSLSPYQWLQAKLANREGSESIVGPWQGAMRSPAERGPGEWYEQAFGAYGDPEAYMKFLMSQAPRRAYLHGGNLPMATRRRIRMAQHGIFPEALAARARVYGQMGQPGSENMAFNPMVMGMLGGPEAMNQAREAAVAMTNARANQTAAEAQLAANQPRPYQEASDIMSLIGGIRETAGDNLTLEDQQTIDRLRRRLMGAIPGGGPQGGGVAGGTVATQTELITPREWNQVQAELGDTEATKQYFREQGRSEAEINRAYEANKSMYEYYRDVIYGRGEPHPLEPTGNILAFPGKLAEPIGYWGQRLYNRLVRPPALPVR